jgi:hypothetical protein
MGIVEKTRLPAATSWIQAIVKTKLPDKIGDGYRLVNRALLLFKSKNGRKQEITTETLISENFPNGLHRAVGGGIGWSKKYFLSITSDDIANRDAQLDAWLKSNPELKPLETL